ncbi:DUF7483 domain-containing protein [Pacificispira sp.]|uniref:DUF7483 domain-containing protein n=1 Tax=Pacificispira sp. TaxID=2888761 RepID=UPI003BACF9D1
MPIFPAAAIASGQVWDADTVAASAWFDGSADYLAKTWGSAPNDGSKWIVSVWVMRTGFGSSPFIFESRTGGPGSGRINLYFNSNAISVSEDSGTAITTNAVYRDTGWFHLVLSLDSDDATAADRLKLWVNGEEVTSFALDNRAANIASGATYNWMANGVENVIGTYNKSTLFFDGYMAQFTSLDGVSIQNGDYSITDFGAFTAAGTNGSIWSPIADSAAVAMASATGGNSFSLTSGIGDGTDASSNSNDFTPTSMSQAANGSANSPSNHYAVMNPNITGEHPATFAEGARRVSRASADASVTPSTLAFPGTGNFYAEAQIIADATTGQAAVGIDYAPQIGNYNVTANNNYLGRTATAYGLTSNGSQTNWRNNDSSTQLGSGAGWADNDIIGLHYDSGDLTVYLNGALVGTISSIDTSVHWHFASACESGGDVRWYFQEDEWTYSAPSGAKALCTANLNTAAYQGADYFNAVLYTGNGATGQAVSGFGFQPDLVWGKHRDLAENHNIFDAVRGADKRLRTNATDAEATTSYFDSFDSDGFTLDGTGDINAATYAAVSWGFKAGGSGAANADGSISSTVSVADAGHFSVITTTMTGGTDQIGHGLPDAPELVIMKDLSNATNWYVYHKDAGETNELYLNLTNAASASGRWGNLAPTSTIIYALLAASDAVLYAFRSVPGVCKVGSYIGNGAAGGPFVWCGFRPRFLMIKVASGGTGNWELWDTQRLEYNPHTDSLRANSSAAEVTFASGGLDILSDGFKHRQTSGDMNTSGYTYVYLAIADVAGGGNLPPVPGR